MTPFGKRGTANTRTKPAMVPRPPKGRSTLPILAAVTILLAAAAHLVPASTTSPDLAAEATAEPPPPSPEARPANPGQANPDQAVRPVVIPYVLCRARHARNHQLRSVCETSQKEAEYTSTTFRIDADVGVLCTQRHPEDWVMFVTCAQAQMAAKLPVTAKRDRPDFDIHRKCQEEWPNNFRMQDHCVEKQRTAKARAGGWIDGRIAVHCADEWPSDWNMYMYCVDRQTAAQRRLR